MTNPPNNFIIPALQSWCPIHRTSTSKDLKQHELNSRVPTVLMLISEFLNPFALISILRVSSQPERVKYIDTESSSRTLIPFLHWAPLPDNFRFTTFLSASLTVGIREFIFPDTWYLKAVPFNRESENSFTFEGGSF